MSFSKLKHQVGMSLVEVMMVMSIMSLIGVGAASLMKNMFSIQNRSNLKSSAAQIKSNLENILRNDTAWANSINDAANFAILGCLQDANPAGCANGGGGNNWSVRNTDAPPGTVYYNASLATQGFDTTGQVCNSYSTVAPDDSCPFRYDLTWVADCGTKPSPCQKPAVTITGTFAFSPTDPSNPRSRMDVTQYNFIIKRGERDRYEPFEIRHAIAGAGGAPPQPGAGPCVPNNWTARPLGTDVNDTGDNVTVAGNQFTVQPGTYECRVMAQSYEAIQGFNIRLGNITNPADHKMIGSGFSGPNSTAYATGTVTLQLTVPTTFQLEHFCRANGPTDSDFDMGIPAGDYSQSSVVSSISCVRSG